MKVYLKNIQIFLTILILCLFLSVDAISAVADKILYVQGSNVNVRERPDRGSAVIMQLQNGAEVIERSREGRWVEVMVSGVDRTGWIHATLLKSEKNETSDDRAESKQGLGDRRTIQDQTASGLSHAPSHQKLDKVEISSGSVSERYGFLKIAVVDVQRIILESVKGKEAQKQIEGLASSRSIEELLRIEQELITKIVNDVRVIVEKYGRGKDFSLILSRREVLFSTERILDITDVILRSYDEETEASGSD